MATIGTYLTFNGNAEDVFNFYKSVFGGEFATFQRFKDTGHGDNLSDQDKEKIMHVALPVGNSILMASDAVESMGNKVIEGTNFSLSVDAKSEDEANAIFSGISAGGKVTMAMEKTFWGAYFGMCTDKFGIQWMVNYDYPKQ